jgi:hypothetical protein
MTTRAREDSRYSTVESIIRAPVCAKKDGNRVRRRFRNLCWKFLSLCIFRVCLVGKKSYLMGETGRLTDGNMSENGRSCGGYKRGGKGREVLEGEGVAGSGQWDFCFLDKCGVLRHKYEDLTELGMG